MVLTRINNNVSAFNASRNLNTTSTALGRSLERLSSGLRINRAADDAAGLSISEGLRAQIRGLARATQNAQDAISLVNTAEGALNETTVRLQRIRELAIQGSNTGGNDAAAIQAAQDEIEQSINEINRIAETTQFGTRKVLNGATAATASIVTGTSNGASVTGSPVASTLSNGTHFLAITQTITGSQTLGVGPDGANNSNATTITNSTFHDGTYTITVANARAADAREIESSAITATGGGAAVGADALTGLVFGGQQLNVGRILQWTGTDAAGNAITTGAMSGGGGDINALIAAIDASYGGAAVVTTITASGQIRIANAVTGESTMSLTLTVLSGANTLYAEGASVEVAGNFNDAVVSVGGGPTQTVRSGQTVTFLGATGTDLLTPQLTLTLGALTNGQDTLTVVQDVYSATLNGGDAVSFRNGDKAIRFITGDSAGTPAGESLTLDFGVSVTAGTTLINAVNNGLYFQIGANKGQGVTVAIGDLAADNLGFTSQTGRTVQDINVTTFANAQDAILIIDEALAQVSRQRSALGAYTNRLESTIANLGVAQENLSASESRIRDADIAFETTLFTRNQILIQAGTAILAQANTAPQAVLQLLQG